MACPFRRLLLLCAVLVGVSVAFNVDTRRPQIHRQAVNSGFGYSVDFVYRTPKKDKYTLLVGAPFAQSAVRGLRNAGAVFGCEVDHNRCAEIAFDLDKDGRPEGNELRLNGSALLPIEEKSHQMFGATLVASKAGDAVLACAPHYKYFFAKFEVVEPVGTCFYAQRYFSKIEEFAPCRQEPARHGHHRFGYGMCGFSAAVAGAGDKRLFIAGPGVWYWQGGVFSQSVANATERPNTADGPAHTDHHQLGYSTAAGDFDGDGVDDVVVGAPRANELIGMVSIYTDTLRPIVNLTDAHGQRGQYFGASVAVADLNNDGLADLIVGSPFYTDYKSVLDAKTQERKPQYDIGKVYVYMQESAGVLRAPVELVGHGQWGRFGHSLSAAGDLNGDGYEDLLVGAPYDGEDGRGAVYVYHGSEDGIRRQHTQRILARDVNRELRTFGFAVRGGRDVDNNDYPDVAVGAVQSNQAVVLRTRPVLQVSGFVRTTRKTINLDEKLCATEFGRMPCEKVRLCVRYGGKLQPEYNTADMRVRVQLDSKKGAQGAPRAFLSRKDLDKKRGVRIDHSPSASREQPDRIEQTLHVHKGREHCETYDIYVPDTIRDKISPIVISVNYTYLEKASTSGGLEPAVDTTLPQTFETELTIEKDCGEDNVCVPDLKISAVSTKDKFTVGTQADQTLTLNVSVHNQGEDSYLTQYYVTIPAGFEYGGIENYETKHKVTCSPVDAKPPTSKQRQQAKNEPYEFVCDIGNPLPANERADFGIKLTGSNIDYSKPDVEVRMSTNSTIAEESGRESDNQLVLHIPIEVKAQLSLVGRSNPEQVDYSVRNRTGGEAATFDFEVGPVVSHLYQVINRGPSAIDAATLDIVWPSFSERGHHLLYLIDMPFISEPTKAKCRINQAHNVNPTGLAISNEHVPTPASLLADADAEEGDARVGHGAPRPRAEEAHEEESSSESSSEDGDDDEFEYRRRAKRQATSRIIQQRHRELKELADSARAAGSAIDYAGEISRRTLNCHDLHCTHIQCDIGRLEGDAFVLVEIFSRLWLNTLVDEAGHDLTPNAVSSLAFAQITALPHVPKYTPKPQVIAVSTTLNPTDPEQFAGGVPLWWLLLAILIALLILLLIVYCCYKCGFFKRNRPPVEKATLQRGPSARGAAGDEPAREHYADDTARYAPPHLYAPERHGAKV